MLKKINDISVLNPSGEIDHVDGDLLLELIGELMRRDSSKIVLDLSEVDHIHYRFLAALTAFARVSSAMAGGIKLANVTPYNREIIRLTGVERFFETYDSVGEAVLSFQPYESCAVH